MQGVARSAVDTHVSHHATQDQGFDVLFLDPPFGKGWIERIAPFLDGLLTDDGTIYVESGEALDSLGNWRTVRKQRAGQVFYHLMRSGKSDGA